MADIPCIYDMSMVNEKDSIKEDIVNGKALDILLLLLSGAKTVRTISKELKIPSFSVQLYIKRLITANLVSILDTRVVDGKIEKTYVLASTDINILNFIENNCKGGSDKDNIELSAQHFATITRDMIRNIDTFKGKPYKIKAYFIKAEEEKINEFKDELDKLFEKYQSLEDPNASETYGFINVLSPYRLDK